MSFFRKPHVFDADGVVVDGATQKTTIALHLYGIHIEPHLFTRANILRTNVLTPDQYEHLKQVAYNDWQYAQRFQFVPGALQSLHMADRLGLPVVLISRRVQEAASYIERLLWQQGLFNVPVFGTGALYEKHEVASHLGGMQTYTDDDIECLPLNAKHPRFLLTQPHNKDAVLHTGVSRVSDWSTLIARVQQLSGLHWQNGLPVPIRRLPQVRGVLIDGDITEGIPQVALSMRAGGSKAGWFDFVGGNVDPEDIDSLSAQKREIWEELRLLPERLHTVTLRIIWDAHFKRYDYAYFFSVKGLRDFVRDFQPTEEVSRVVLFDPRQWPENMLSSMLKHMAPVVTETVLDLAARQQRLFR